MKEKWKLCVMSGSIMVFAVLGALILVQTVMSSADGKGKEFRLTGSAAGQIVSGSVVSGNSVSESAVSGNSVSEDTNEEKGRPVPHKKKNDEGIGTSPKKEEPETPIQNEGENVEGNWSSDKTEAEATCGFVKEEDSIGEQIASYAQELQGVPYVYGGTKLPKKPISVSYSWLEGDGKDMVELAEGQTNLYGDEYGVDCSGLVQGVFGKFKIKLPRSVKDQAKQGKEIKLKDARPGDIIFYGASNAKLTHCGIYVGKEKIVHVSARTKFVTVSDMNYRRIAKVVRVVEE